MACDLTLGRKEPCYDSVGGIRAIYLIMYGTITPVYELVGNTDEITDLGAITAYKYETRTGANWKDALAKNADGGTVFNTQTVLAILKKIDSDTTRELKLAAQGRPHVVVEIRNGESYICGIDEGCDFNWELDSGTARGDLNGYTVTITGETKAPAALLQGSVTDDPFAGLTGVVTVVEGV